ncbi:hypothetical protein KSF73_13690 [Burkholderiaceae bacterium DAT-1]|nr:hypothetical protein [Burkholderiaceae bacterium DAT-1]
MKRPILNLLMVSLISASLALPAQARLGGSSGGSRSTAVAPRSAVTQPGRVGGGKSVGMQRDQVVNNVRNGNVPPQGAAQAAPNAAPAYAAQPQQAQRSGPGWGTVAGAAAAGAAVGYLAGHSNTPQAVAPAPAVQAVAPAGTAPAAGYTQPQSSGGSFMPLLLILGLVGIAAWFMFRRAGNRPAAASVNQAAYDAAPRDFSIPSIGSGNQAAGNGNARTTLLPQAEKLYRDLQQANSTGDHGYLRAHCTDALYAELAPTVGAGQTFVNTVSCILADDSAGMASIRYRAVLTEDGGHPEEIDEVWHFVQQGTEWRLAGIQQV